MNTILFPVDFLENQISQIALPDLKRICRICMGCSPVMSDIFMIYEGQPINEFIMECFPVQIQAGEKLPESICSPCLEKIETIRQFRILCLHSDRVLRNELSNILQQSNSISVLPAGINGNVEGSFVDQSGNQVILLSNKDNNNSDDPEQQTSTYYILQDSGEHMQLRHEIHNSGMVDANGMLVPSHKNNEELILIEDEEEEDHTLSHNQEITHLTTDEPELVISNVQSIGGNAISNRRRTLTDDDDDAENAGKAKKPKKRIRRRKTKNPNSPEFQFVDINEAGCDDNLIEILEDESESVDVKICERCSSTYQTSLLEHNLICAQNYRNCQFCGVENLNVLDFDQHIRDQHIREYRVCQNCRQVFLEEKHFLHHFCKRSIVADFDVNVYTCAFCLGTFDSLKSFTHHYYKEHHKKSNCSCGKAS